MGVGGNVSSNCNVDCYFCNAQDVRTKEQIPIKRAVDLIDELVERGLRSIRLAGGGEPLFHREILDVIDHIERRSVVIDNVTTNGVALDPDARPCSVPRLEIGSEDEYRRHRDAEERREARLRLAESRRSRRG